MPSQSQERGRSLLPLTYHSCCPVQAATVWPAQLLNFSHLPYGPPWWNGSGPMSSQSRAGSGPGFSGLGPLGHWKIQGWRWHNFLGLPALLPPYHRRETVSFTCRNVVWCVLCRGGQSLILISEVCPCLYVPGAAGCLCYQDTVHTIGSSTSLIRMLQVSGQTPAVLPPLGAGLWVGRSSLRAWASNQLLTCLV